jgi:hypothetical protein
MSNQSEPKLKQLFAAMVPYLLLLNHSMALVCDQWAMFFCETSCYGGTSLSAQPSLFLGKIQQKFGNVQPIWAQTEADVCSHCTSSSAAEPFHGLGMWPTSDVLLWNQLLVDRPCLQSQVSFWARSSQQSESLEMSNQSEPKLKKLFAAIAPHLLLMDHSMALVCGQWVLLNHSMALVCDQWVMVFDEARSCWWTIPAKPSQFLSDIWSKKFGNVQPIWAQTEADVCRNSTSSSALNHSMALVYVANEWCFAVKTASGGPAFLPSQVCFWARSKQKFGNVQPIWDQNEADVCSHCTSSSAAESFHGLGMLPMSDVLLWNQLLVDHPCLQSHIWSKVWKCPTNLSPNWSRCLQPLHLICCCWTIPWHCGMCPMSDVLLWKQLLVDQHSYQAKSVFGPDPVKNLQRELPLVNNET